jgi:hypothetical protein
MMALGQDCRSCRDPRDRRARLVFYPFNTPPMLFNRVYDAQVAASRAAELWPAAGVRARWPHVATPCG